MANNKKSYTKKSRKKANKAPVQSAAKIQAQTKEKKFPAKLLGIIGAVVAAVAVIVLSVLLIRSVPKNIKTAVESHISTSFRCDVKSLAKEKTYKPENSEFEKETIYLITRNLESGEDGNPYLDDGHVIVLVRVTTVNGEENIEFAPIKPFKQNEKASYNATLKALKETPADWQAMF
jgi:hypothetical protein